MKAKTILIGVLLALCVITACGDKIQPGTSQKDASPPVKAPLAVAEVTQQPFYYEAVGTITARTASTISSKLMGVVRAVHVQEGDLLKKGDLLVTIDPRQVTAQLERAQAAAEVAAKEYKRYRQLLKEQSASQQEFDRAEAQYRQAQAAVAAAKVSQKDAQVRAPYDGRVVAKMINEGDLASPGTPFVTMEQEGLYCADLVLPERHIQAVQLGLSVQVAVPALNDQKVEGTVGRIVPTADAQSRSFQVKVAMPQGLDLKSGMFARIYIPLGGTGKLLVPRGAIINQGQLSGLFIVDDQSVARFRLVRNGKTHGDRVEIISGLKAGQRYVTVVPPSLKDGMKVDTNG